MFTTGHFCKKVYYFPLKFLAQFQATMSSFTGYMYIFGTGLNIRCRCSDGGRPQYKRNAARYGSDYYQCPALAHLFGSLAIDSLSLKKQPAFNYLWTSSGVTRWMRAHDQKQPWMMAWTYHVSLGTESGYRAT